MRINCEAFDSNGESIGKFTIGNFRETDNPDIIKNHVKESIKCSYMNGSKLPTHFIVRLYNKHTKPRTIIAVALRDDAGKHSFRFMTAEINRRFIG